MKKTIAILSCGLLIACGNPSSESSKKVDSTSVEQENVSKTNEKEEASKWTYDETQDKMGDINKAASLVSDDILEFEFPYDGGVESTLIIRKKGKDLDIMYQVSKGQIVSANPIDGGSVRVKFDDEAPSSFAVVGASDHSSDVIFFTQTKKLLDKIKKSKKMVVEVEFFNEGNRQITFNTQGLEWN